MPSFHPFTIFQVKIFQNDCPVNFHIHYLSHPSYIPRPLQPSNFTIITTLNDLHKSPSSSLHIIPNYPFILQSSLLSLNIFLWTSSSNTCHLWFICCMWEPIKIISYKSTTNVPKTFLYITQIHAFIFFFLLLFCTTSLGGLWHPVFFGGVSGQWDIFPGIRSSA
jgi:hypothetical protein